jgi:hypothetical protein
VIDPMGSLIVELRETAAVAALVGARVRAREPHGATDSYEGDALGPGAYKAFLVLVQLSLPPDRRVPVTVAEYAVRCYGRTSEEASAVYGAVVDALHRRGPRLRPNGLGIYATWVTGGASDVDPKTQQPVVTGTIQLTATTQAVTV